MESKTNYKFGEMKCQVNELKVIEAIKRKKHFIKFENEIDGKALCMVEAGKLGMLADFLEIPKLNFRRMVENQDIVGINNLLRNCDKEIQIFSNVFNDMYWIFNIASPEYCIIKFGDVRRVLKEYFGLEFNEFIESDFGGVKVWEKQYRCINVCDDKIDIIIRITSGNNKKKSAAKVIVYGRVHSCENSIRAMVYTSIKHYAGWKEKLINTLDESIEVVEAIENTIKMGAEKVITIEEGNDIIDNIQLKIRDVNKIERVKTALKTRFAHEYKINQNRFALSQAFSFVGTYTQPEYSSAETLLILQQQAYEVFM